MRSRLNEYGAMIMVAGLLATACAESENRAPSFVVPPDDAEFRVQEVGRIDLLATDPDDDPLRFDFEIARVGCDAAVEECRPESLVSGAANAPELVRLGNNEARFTWRPGVLDAGREAIADYNVIFTVSDGQKSDAETVLVRVVNQGVGGSGRLRFVEPPGAGMASERDCVDNLRVEVKGDQIDEGTVTLALAEPRPQGASLVEGSTGKEAFFTWCPPQELLDQSLNHTVTFTAQHAGADEPIAKRFQIRFRRQAGAGCPGDAPLIQHDSPGSFSGPLNYDIDAVITDDVGFKDRPVLAFQPGDLPGGDGVRPDTSGWQIVEFAPVEGSDDVWRASIPNLGLAEGETRRMNYVISATDDDDPEGTRCDHTTETPLYAFEARGGAGAGATYAFCSPCVSDAQCGGRDDLCVDPRGQAFCARACTESADCGAEQTCVEWESVDGVTALQCLPDSLACEMVCSADAIDARGRNDAEETAAQLEPGSHSLSICGDDQDWFRVPVQIGQAIEVSAHFDNASGDLDLAMGLPGGQPLEYQSLSGDADEEAVAEFCVPRSGEALIAVFPYQGAQNNYTLDVSVGPGQCDVACPPDQFDLAEPNDRPEQFTALEPPFDSQRENVPLSICRENADLDFFGFDARAGQQIQVLAEFEHRRGDINLALYRSEELDEDDPLPLADSQGFRDLELIEAVAPADDIYILVVFGATSTVNNPYDLLVEISDVEQCQSSLECRAGEYCSDEGCAASACMGLGACDGAHACTPPRAGRAAGVAGSACLASCSADRDCRVDSGYACKRLEEGIKVCAAAGAGQAGERCSSHQDCSGGLGCFDLPGGYCAAGGCFDSPCPAGTVCGDAGRFIDVCLKPCTGDGDCRVGEGYACMMIGGGQRGCALP